jgi:hypothetical protein
MHVACPLFAITACRGKPVQAAWPQSKHDEQSDKLADSNDDVAHDPPDYDGVSVKAIGMCGSSLAGNHALKYDVYSPYLLRVHA